MINNEFKRELEELLGKDNLSELEIDRIFYSRDLWPRTLIWLKQGEIKKHLPDLIVWPQSQDELIEVVKVCAKYKVRVIPWGGGSGVCGGTLPIGGGIIVDLKKLNRVVELDKEGRIVRVEPGIIGQELEDYLNCHGFTLGHFPSSIYCSTVGGWVATRSAGQFSSKYGKIEDMIVSMKVVTPDGLLLELGNRGKEIYFNPALLITGGEGRGFIVSEVTFCINPIPEYRFFRSFGFNSLELGLKAAQKIMQEGIRPETLRLYDEFDSIILRLGSLARKKDRNTPQLIGKKGLVFQYVLKQLLDSGSRLNRIVPFLRELPTPVILILTFSGNNKRIVVEEEEETSRICKQFGGKDLGEGIARDWFTHRYSISYLQSIVFRLCGFSDTMEVSTSWDEIIDLYKRVKSIIGKYAFVMAHFSHAYSDGCSIYFTFVARGEEELQEGKYMTLWEEALGAVAKMQATISHHHGVGISKSFAMQSYYSHETLKCMERIIKLYDPYEIFNPGKLVP